MSSALLALGIGLVAAGSAVAAPLQIAVSFQNLGEITARVAGPEGQVQVLAAADEDPHAVVLRSEAAERSSRADLVLTLGLGLEESWLPSLVVKSKNPKLVPGTDRWVEASKWVSVLDLPIASKVAPPAHAHPQGNPHYLLDPRNSLRVARGLAQHLAQLDPAHGQAYQSRAEAFCTEWNKKITDWELRAKSLTGQSVLTYHRSWVYLINWLGLVSAGEIEQNPGIPASLQHVVSLTQKLKAAHPKWILIDPWAPLETAKGVGSGTGAEIVIQSPEAGGTRTYESIFESLITRWVGKPSGKLASK